MKVKVNRKHFIEVDNIETILCKERILYISQREGYPAILKSDCNLQALLNRVINLGADTRLIEKVKGKVVNENINS